MKKFDVVVGNPPYKWGIHLTFFNTAFNLLKNKGIMAVIHPSTPFIMRKPTGDNKNTQQVKEIVTKHKTRITLINGNDYFDAGFFVPLSITIVEKVIDPTIEVVYSHYDKNNTDVHVYDTIDNVYMHGNDIVLGIKNKIFAKMNINLASRLSRNGYAAKYHVKINLIAANIPKKDGKLNPDFNCLIYKKYETQVASQIGVTPMGKPNENNVGVQSKKHAVNAFNYFLTKFARFALSLHKINQNLNSRELKAVPYMDFSQEWTDQKLFAYFELTQEEQDFINNYIGDWYARDFKHTPSN